MRRIMSTIKAVSCRPQMTADIEEWKGCARLKGRGVGRIEVNNGTFAGFAGLVEPHPLNPIHNFSKLKNRG
jgi:hypothetical protein